MDENQEADEVSHENAKNESYQNALEDHFSSKGYECRIRFIFFTFKLFFSSFRSFIFRMQIPEVFVFLFSI